MMFMPETLFKGGCCVELKHNKSVEGSKRERWHKMMMMVHRIFLLSFPCQIHASFQPNCLCLVTFKALEGECEVIRFQQRGTFSSFLPHSVSREKK